MATFPSYPALLFDGYKVDRQTAVIRTQMEDGFAKQRKRFSRVLVERPVVYLLKSQTDYNNFITWFNTTINRGADWFDWINPNGGATLTARIKEGKIEEIPVTKILDKWEIKFTLETWDA